MLCSRTVAKAFQLSKDPVFIEKARDIVGLYLNPPDKALVLYADEKTQIQVACISFIVLETMYGELETILMKSRTLRPF